MKFGFVKPYLDAHTLGVSSIIGLLSDCGYEAVIAPEEVSKAVERIDRVGHYQLFKEWLVGQNIDAIGFSYRLDPNDAVEMFSRLMYVIDNDNEINGAGKNKVQLISFAGLPKACELVKEKFGSRVKLFQGDESPLESLALLGVPKYKYPTWLLSQSEYDDDRWLFSKDLVDKGVASNQSPLPELGYANFKNESDTILERVRALDKLGINLPLLRAHVGPYSENAAECLGEFHSWLNQLNRSGHLDIVSIGSSQLTQERFGEDWSGLANGGGVPVNSEEEFSAIKKAAKGILVRSYSATKEIESYAEMLERTINNSWHALSFWWFNLSDGRGPLSVYETLFHHSNTLKVIAKYNKPFEPNISHHFSFRGSDDLSGIVSTFLVVKLAKSLGIKNVILQTMLNTPKLLSGVADLAKFRALLQLVKCLEDKSFRVITQPRAGLAYFSPDLEKAKIQLASVSMLMTDIEPRTSPSIVHVVSYSEAVHLATPPIIDESAQITRSSISNYLSNNNALDILSPKVNQLVDNSMRSLLLQAEVMIKHMELSFSNLYSPEGLYNIYKAGYFPVPQLWNCRVEFECAVNWKTQVFEGQMVVADENGKPMTMAQRLSIVENNIANIKARGGFK